MAHWLLKTEPRDYSFADLMRDKRTVWTGVSNPVALKNIRQMRDGDLAFVYHTGDEKQIVGIAEVASDPYPDPKAKDERLVVVDLKARRSLEMPVTLAQIKADARFKEFALVRISRLSVMPVTDALWKALLAMAGEPARGS
jgi:predicted RNA-binding protein with PUA-like domain